MITKNINIHNIREYIEDKINKRINGINDPNIKPEKKRLYILDVYNSSNYLLNYIDYTNNTKPIFNIIKIRDYRETKIKEKMKNIKNEKLCEKQKLLLVLDEINTSSSSNSEEKESRKAKEITKEELKDVKIENNYPLLSNISTGCSSSFTDFNDEKKKYWLKYNLYDVKVENRTFNYPILFPIKEKEKKFCYLYKNDLITCYFIKSVQFGEEYSINNDILIDNQYNESHGLFFCGNKIELENNEIKKCCPNEMMCKECMEKNKKRYKIKNKHLININGREAKKNKSNNFHCYGKFIIGNQLENCIQKFICASCQLLTKYETYYFSE